MDKNVLIKQCIWPNILHNQMKAFENQVRQLKVKQPSRGYVKDTLPSKNWNWKSTGPMDDEIWQYLTNLTCQRGNASRGSVKCNICEKDFKFVKVEEHLERVHGIKDARSRKGKSMESRHSAFWRNHCDQDPNYKTRCICRICGKNISKLSAAKHLGMKHKLSEQWYLCSYCGKSFFSKEARRFCELRHTNSFQYRVSQKKRPFVFNRQQRVPEVGYRQKQGEF